MADLNPLEPAAARWQPIRSLRSGGTTCEGGRVVLEADWSATVLMDLKYWDSGDTIHARTSPVFEVRDGQIVSQDSYDCYFLNS